MRILVSSIEREIVGQETSSPEIARMALVRTSSRRAQSVHLGSSTG